MNPGVCALKFGLRMCSTPIERTKWGVRKKEISKSRCPRSTGKRQHKLGEAGRYW